jgi:hypothetical protein
MRLAELRELTLPPTSVAERAWERAQRRRRRNTMAGVVAAGVLVAATVVGVGAVRVGGDPPAPAPVPGTTSPSTTTSATPPTITNLPDFAALAASVPTLAPTDPTPISADPVHRAVAAVAPQDLGSAPSWAAVDVLGDDGRWRSVDVPGLVGTTDGTNCCWFALVPTGLDPSGTRLALPQPDRVVIVDLTTGGYDSYHVDGLNNTVIWQDIDHVVVSVEGRPNGRVLDLRDKSVTSSAFTANTGFANDGSWVTWGRDRTLTSSDGTGLQADMANDGVQLTSPLVDDDVAVGLGGHDLAQGLTTYVGVAGAGVVDRHSGELRAFLYTEGTETDLLPTYLLGLDGDTVTLAVGVPPDYGRLLVLHWNWSTGEVTPVAVLPAGMVSGPLD